MPLERRPRLADEAAEEREFGRDGLSVLDEDEGEHRGGWRRDAGGCDGLLGGERSTLEIRLGDIMRGVLLVDHWACTIVITS